MKRDPFILIVDDDADDRYFLTVAVHSVSPNAKVEEAKDGREALAFLESNCKGECGVKPDLIFLDLSMDLLGGHQTTKIIKKSVDFCHIPVIILTASVRKDEREVCMRLGASNYYTKPSSPEVLNDIVREVTEQHLV